MPTTQNEISMLIKEIRMRTGLTQEKLAAKLGVTFPTVNRWENGRTRPSPLAIGRIRELLDSTRNDEPVLSRILEHRLAPQDNANIFIEGSYATINMDGWPLLEEGTD